MGSSFQVYDCKYEALRELLYLSSGQNEQEFCIVDKKYSWLLFFKVDRMKDIVEIYKSGRIELLAWNLLPLFNSDLLSNTKIPHLLHT